MIDSDCSKAEQSTWRIGEYILHYDIYSHRVFSVESCGIKSRTHQLLMACVRSSNTTQVVYVEHIYSYANCAPHQYYMMYAQKQTAHLFKLSRQSRCYAAVRQLQRQRFTERKQMRRNSRATTGNVFVEAMLHCGPVYY